MLYTAWRITVLNCELKHCFNFCYKCYIPTRIQFEIKENYTSVILARRMYKIIYILCFETRKTHIFMPGADVDSCRVHLHVTHMYVQDGWNELDVDHVRYLANWPHSTVCVLQNVLLEIHKYISILT